MKDAKRCFQGNALLDATSLQLWVATIDRSRFLTAKHARLFLLARVRFKIELDVNSGTERYIDTIRSETRNKDIAHRSGSSTHLPSLIQVQSAMKVFDSSRQRKIPSLSMTIVTQH